MARKRATVIQGVVDASVVCLRQKRKSVSLNSRALRHSTAARYQYTTLYLQYLELFATFVTDLVKLRHPVTDRFVIASLNEFRDIAIFRGSDALYLLPVLSLSLQRNSARIRLPGEIQ